MLRLLYRPTVTPCLGTSTGTVELSCAAEGAGLGHKLLCVTLLDWLIVVFTAAFTFYGYAQGFIVGALSLAGFALGAFLGAHLGTLLLPGGSSSKFAPLCGLAGALLAGGVLASGFEGLGLHARAALRLPGLRAVDGVFGAVLTTCVGLGIAWILGAITLYAAGSLPLRKDIQRSAILSGLNQLLPPSGPILHALARIDPLPAVRGPAADVRAPNRAILAARGPRAARGGVVRVLGNACGLGVEGSGWVAAPGVVVTNAHVVAGESDTAVEVGGHPPDLAARAVAFNPHDDIAVLRVAGLAAPALGLAVDPRAGTAAAILGYPLDGPFDAQPGRIGSTEPISTGDAYGNGPVIRSITSLRGRVRPGNSGGPMVDGRGEVVATVFGSTVGAVAGGAGGFAVPNGLVRHELALAGSRSGSVSTGPCTG
jgi:hypothetical protein